MSEMKMPPSEAEQRLLRWFAKAFRARLDNPRRTVPATAALEFAEVEKKAAALGCQTYWVGGIASRDRWIEIRGFELGQKILLEWGRMRRAELRRRDR